MNSIARTAALVDSAHNLTVEAASSARLVNSRPVNRDASFGQIKKLLDSRNDREILDGLRKVISILYRSKPSLAYFSSVIKNVASPNIEIKKLVYIYLIHHAESEPDLALLSINTIQKSLSDQNPQIRAMALRVMSGIRVPVISQIVSLAIKKGIVDMSPYVRKAAALAIPKCYDLDPNTEPQLLDYVSTLLGDKQYFVVGPAVTAFLHICPHRLDLIHKHYRALIRKIVDMDEWSQVATLRLMIYYARRCFPRRTRRVSNTKGRGFYEDENEPQTNAEGEDAGFEVIDVDPDLTSLLKACKSLLSSRNSAVIIAAVRCLIHLGTPTDLASGVGPLIALLRASKDIQVIAMYNIVLVCLMRPELFVRYATHFLVKFADSLEICGLKFEVLALIYPHCEVHVAEIILAELEHFAHSNDPPLVRESVRAIGRCAHANDAASGRCLSLLLSQVSTEDGTVVAEALNVIRLLIQKDPQQHTSIVIKLAKNLDTLTDSRARATVIWLVGEYAGLPDDQNIAPDVLRILAKGFVDEAKAAKMQIILLAAKVYLHYLLRTKPPSKREDSSDLASGVELEAEVNSKSVSGDDAENNASPDESATDAEHTIKLLWDYVLQLTHYDTSYDLRDRARFYQALLANPSSTQLAALVLLAPKPVSDAPSPSQDRKNYLFGSSSLVLANKSIIGAEDVPEWVKEGDEPDRKLREEPTMGAQADPRAVSAAAELDRAVKEKGLADVPGPSQHKSLDDWLDEKTEEGLGHESEEEEDEDEESSQYEEVTASESEGEIEDEKEPLVQ